MFRICNLIATVLIASIDVGYAENQQYPQTREFSLTEFTAFKDDLKAGNVRYGNDFLILEEADVNNDGKSDYVVVANCGGSLCTQTIVDVFTERDGKIVAIDFGAVKYKGKKPVYLPSFFADPFLTQENGQTYMNFTEDRKTVSKYHWDKDGLVFVSQLKAPAPTPWAESPAGPSFNCSKITRADEQIICVDAALAKADSELNHAFKLRIGKLVGAEKTKFQATQRQWIKSRNSECDVPKEFVAPDKIPAKAQCLLKAFQKRISEMKS